ncbi:MAG: NAD-dependent epimerase/dehydratase family protein [Alphaproteobacteria bacterium]
MTEKTKPTVLITGAAGGIGTALSASLKDRYRVVGLDRSDLDEEQTGSLEDYLRCDLTSDESVALFFYKFKERYGNKIAAVIHLAAYFDFTGEDSPLYETVNVEGTRRLLQGLQDFAVERFIFSGTMLVHQPCKPGERIDEETPLAPKWAYPRSKAAAEKVIEEEHGEIPYLLLRLSGLYSDRMAVPTLSQQIARIYERDIKSRVYSGDLLVGQSFLHTDDMIDAFMRAVDRRNDLPPEATILVGEPEAMGYGALQDELGRLIHGEENWTTIEAPKGLARVGAWLEEKSEPIVPDVIDQGEAPFIRPFMIDMADDHYALDISRARELLGWSPAHWIGDELPKLVTALKDDPAQWYEENGITAPLWLQSAARKVDNPEKLRARHEEQNREAHSRFIWAHFATMGLGFWLATSPPILGYESAALVISDFVSGILLIMSALVSLSTRYGLVRWVTAAIGLWVMSAPLIFWAPTAAAYLNDTLVGALAFGFAVLTRPPPGVSAVAALTGPTVPPGWDFSPSSWFQRAPIIFLALIGLVISRYLAAYQLGHIDSVWEPFFEGGPSPMNGTEEIITSSVSEAWPVSDAGLGAITYMLEILTGIIGSARRWRTMPWLVVLFGFMIVPLGAVSITFIIIQPLVIGTWCTLCLVAAVAMLVQIPYSLDELVATGQFLVRRRKAGANVMRIFFTGDTDDGRHERKDDTFEQSPGTVVREMVSGGVGLPWNLCLSIAIGVWLMLTRLVLGTQGGMADADHLIGALVITVTVTSLAEVARPLRFLNIAFGVALLITPFVYGADLSAMVSSLACGAGLIALGVRRGRVRQSYGEWSRFVF